MSQLTFWSYKFQHHDQCVAAAGPPRAAIENVKQLGSAKCAVLSVQPATKTQPNVSRIGR